MRGDRVASRVAHVAGAAISFVVPFLLTFIFIFNYFFAFGAPYLDAGWFADLMWHKAWWLPNPDVGQIAPNFPPRSYYGIHVSPLLAAISQISRLLPFDHIDIFAAYIATAHGLLGLFLWLVLQGERRRRSPIALAFSTLASVVFALNGLAISVTSYPHIEILIPGLVLLTLYLLLNERLLTAAAIGALALSIREDVGFHFFAIAGLLIVFNRLRGVPLSGQKALTSFAVVGLLYSCGAVFLQKHFFPSQDTFAHVYAGHPPFGHLTAEFAWARLTRFFEVRAYVWLPLLLICVSAVVLRSAPVLVGALAVLPWMLLHLLALSDAAGTLDSHYVFPIITAVGWTAIALMRPDLTAAHRGGYFSRLGLIGATVLTTFAGNPKVMAFLHETVPTEQALHPQGTRQFVDALSASVPGLRQLRADSGAISLRPDMFTPQVWLVPQDWTGDRRPSADVDVLVFFNRGFEREKALVQLGAMANPRLYSVSGTNILVAVAANAELGARAARLLVPAPNSAGAIPYFFTGFYPLDSGLRWARTRSPSLHVWNCAASTLRLRVIGYALWPKGAAGSARPDAFRIHVTVNRTRQSTLEFTPSLQQQSLDVPIRCVDREMAVRFDYDYLISPSQHSDSADARMLGIGIVGDPEFD
jgi:hypothetical protein